MHFEIVFLWELKNISGLDFLSFDFFFLLLRVCFISWISFLSNSFSSSVKFISSSEKSLLMCESNFNFLRASTTWDTANVFLPDSVHISDDLLDRKEIYFTVSFSNKSMLCFSIFKLCSLASSLLNFFKVAIEFKVYYK